MSMGRAVVQLVEELNFKPDDRGFDCRWGHGIFNYLNPSGRTGMATWSVSWGLKADGVYGLQPCNLHVPTVYKYWKPQPPAALRASPDMNWDRFT